MSLEGACFIPSHDNDFDGALRVTKIDILAEDRRPCPKV